MFRGINTVNIDHKGRIAIPIKYRDIFDLSAVTCPLIITIDTQERCLLMYSLINWEELEKKIEMLPSFNPAARRIQRLLIGHATEVMLDQQNRVLLPQELRDYAKLTKKAMLVGQGKKIEIWDFDNWNNKRDLWLEDPGMKANDLPEELNILAL